MYSIISVDNVALYVSHKNMQLFPHIDLGYKAQVHDWNQLKEMPFSKTELHGTNYLQRVV